MNFWKKPFAKIAVFDKRVNYFDQQQIFAFAINSRLGLGWNDVDEPEKYEKNLHSRWNEDDCESSSILRPIRKCINETSWFTKKKFDSAVLNLIRPSDVHYIHCHADSQVALYYINLEWKDGWHGETIFYDNNDQNSIVFTSPYVAGRIILFDGSIPHTIRPQSIRAPKYRLTLSCFFK